MEFNMKLITNLMCKEKCLWYMVGLMLLDRKGNAWKLWIQDTLYQSILISMKWRTIEGEDGEMSHSEESHLSVSWISLVIKQLLILWRTLIYCCIIAYFSWHATQSRLSQVVTYKHLESTQFESELGHQLFWVFCGFPQYQRQIPGYYFRRGHGHVLPNLIHIMFNA
jgi:hypothetical protein